MALLGRKQTPQMWSLVMNTIRAASLLCFSLILAAVKGEAADNKLQPILEGRYAAMKSAMANRDAKQIATLLAPDFVSIDVSGKQTTGDQMIESLKALPVNPDRVSNTTLLSIESSGNKAVVKQRYNMKTARAGADGAKQEVELTTLSTDVWILSSGTWVLQQTVTDQMDAVVDGKPLVHRVRKSEP
jgi:ketosteroid isomerase-like protein